MLQARNHTLRGPNEFVEINETGDERETNLGGFRVESFIGFQGIERYRVVADSTGENNGTADVSW